MKTALIGHTGFVGSNLKEQFEFSQLYNSKNISNIDNKQFDIIVCSGLPAVKWLANKKPEMDLKNTKNLQYHLKTVKAKQFILISTIDVYPILEGSNEDYDCTQKETHAYGKHRLMFENFCKLQFPNLLIVRLPALFGKYMKKNVIYDLINRNCLEMINLKSSFQYYNLENLWKDITIATDHNLEILNLFTEPILTNDIVSKLFPNLDIKDNDNPSIHYDLHTKHSSIWNQNSPYLYTKKQVFDDLQEFISKHKDLKDEK